MKQPSKPRSDPDTTNKCEWCAHRPAETTAVKYVAGVPIRLNVCKECK